MTKKDSNGLITIHVRYLKNGKAPTGAPLHDTTLEATLVYCNELPRDGEKGSYGAILFYDSDEFGISELKEILSTGCIVCDIDNLPREIAERIYNSFDVLVCYFPQITAIQYSSSWALGKDRCGLHIYFHSDPLTYSEYEYYATLCMLGVVEIIEQALNIDIREFDEGEKKCIDFHNTKISQRIFLFYSPYKYNKDALKVCYDSFSTETVNELTKKYGVKLNEPCVNEKGLVNINPVYGRYIAGNKDKIKIDRNVNVGKYSGNELRWRISVIADKFFGDKAKEFCDSNFYYENGKSIYVQIKKDISINPLVLKWLEEKGYIEKEVNKYTINEYISEFHENIIKTIDNYNKCEIIAPTGSGKTTYINEKLAVEKNAVVITPFNVTNKLYDRLELIDSKYKGSLPSDKPLVMVWDQAVKRWGEIKDRLIIVDEAHTLFNDRNYRDAAVKLVQRLKDESVKCCFITATPTGETKWVEKTVRYDKNRDIIRLYIRNVTNINWSELNFVKAAYENKWADRIVIFDDKNAGVIYEKLVIEGYGEDIAYIRADKKDTEDFKRLRDEERLTKPITICTCVAFNGLNFKNEGEKILVIGSIREYDTTSCSIIQQIGRIRKSKVVGYYFYNGDDETGSDDMNIEDKTDRAQKLAYINSEGCVVANPDSKWLDNYYIDAMTEINEYVINHSKIDIICKELSDTGYIKGNIKKEKGEDDTGVRKMTRELKRLQSNNIYEDIISGDFLKKDYYDYTGDYEKIWFKEIHRLIDNPNYEGITFELLQKIVTKKNNNALIDSYIRKLKDIILACKQNEESINKLKLNKDRWIAEIVNIYDKKELKRKINTIIRLWKKYRKKIRIEDGVIYITGIIHDIIEEEEIRIKKLKDNNTKSGKIGGKIGKTCVITDKFKLHDKYGLNIGDVFYTQNELADKCNVNIATISKWRKKEWVV